MRTTARFFVPANTIDRAQGVIAYEDISLTKQLTRVLRLGSGDKIDLLDGSGNLFHCRITSCQNGQLIAAIKQEVKLDDTGSIRVTVALPVLKGERFDWALEKMTEIGVAKIVPIVVERSVVKPSLSPKDKEHAGKDPRIRFTRWHTILKESSEQCERAMIPQLVLPTSYNKMLEEESLDPHSLKIICTERRSAPHLSHFLEEQLQQHRRECKDNSLYNHKMVADITKVVVVIGAEGGFTEAEVNEAIKATFNPVTLGTSILRSETAAIYALVIATSCLFNTASSR
jgi:16S rRNA (uracil1498-N3)-methyltransferase